MALNVEKTDENENEDEKAIDLDLRTISVPPWKLTPEYMEWKDKQKGKMSCVSTNNSTHLLIRQRISNRQHGSCLRKKQG